MDELDVREDLMVGEVLATGHATLFSGIPGGGRIGTGFAGGGRHFVTVFFFGDVDVDVDGGGL